MSNKLKILLALPMLIIRHRSFIKEFGWKAFKNSLRLNFRCFNFQDASKFPVYLAKNTRLKSLDGKISIDAPLETGMIRFGTYEIGTYDAKSEFGIIDLKNNSEIIFKGKALFGVGCRLSVNRNGKLTFGENFTVTAAATIICSSRITFGDNCLLSWEILLMDTDLHTILPASSKKEEIEIGNRAWIGCRCTILKSTQLADNTIIGANSLLNGAFSEENTLIAGNPGKVIKQNVSWK